MRKLITGRMLNIGAVLFLSASLMGLRSVGAEPPESSGKPATATAMPVQPDLLSKRVASLKHVYKCKGCDGCGTVKKREKIGEERRGGLIYPITKEVEVECKACNGLRYGKQQIILQRLSDLVGAWATVDRKLPKADVAMIDAKKALIEFARHHPQSLQTFINSPIISMLAQDNGRISQPIHAIGTVTSESTDPATDVRTIEIGIDVVHGARIVVRQARAVDALVGEEVIVGGLLLEVAAGNSAAGHPKKLVLTEGFVFSVRR